MIAKNTALDEERQKISKYKSSNLTRMPNTRDLASKVLNYMEQRKFNIRALLSKAAKKYRSYVIMDGSRLHGAALSAENLQYEVAADWLSRIFVHDKSIEKLVSDNMSLAIELADEIKSVADRSSDIEFKKFANDVFYNFYKYFRKPDNLSKYNSEKSKLYNGGIQTLALDNEDNGHRVNMDGWQKQPIGERLKNNYYDMKRGFIDSGAVTQVGNAEHTVEADVGGKTKFIPGDYVVTDDKLDKFVYQITATKAVTAAAILDISEEKAAKAAMSGISKYEYVKFVCETGIYSSDGNLPNVKKL